MCRTIIIPNPLAITTPNPSFPAEPDVVTVKKKKPRSNQIEPGSTRRAERRTRAHREWMSESDVVAATTAAG